MAEQENRELAKFTKKVLSIPGTTIKFSFYFNKDKDLISERLEKLENLYYI